MMTKAIDPMSRWREESQQESEYWSFIQQVDTKNCVKRPVCRLRYIWNYIIYDSYVVGVFTVWCVWQKACGVKGGVVLSSLWFYCIKWKWLLNWNWSTIRKTSTWLVWSHFSEVKSTTASVIPPWPQSATTMTMSHFNWFVKNELPHSVIICILLLNDLGFNVGSCCCRCVLHLLV